jgi:hypothetical protein
VKSTKLYRAVGEAEFQDLTQNRVFQSGPSSLEGKWFAESADDAAKWGEALLGSGNYRVIEVELPAEMAEQFFRMQRLDNIGPARYGELHQLRDATFREVKYE